MKHNSFSDFLGKQKFIQKSNPLSRRRVANENLRRISALPRQYLGGVDSQTVRIETLLPPGTRRRVPSETPPGHERKLQMRNAP